MKRIDLNCDMGEGFGPYSFGHDNELMRYITSANIACGFHAGDPTIINRTVRLAIEHHVNIGAHPSLPDLQGFGRRKMDISPRETYELMLYQVGALHAFAVANGSRLTHVKPHGALYNMAAVEPAIAEAIAEAIYQLNPEMILYGLAGSELIQAGNKLGLQTANEAFADRTYQNDGTLTSRQDGNAVLNQADDAIAQALKMVKDQLVTTVNGSDITIHVDTICIHGDGKHALTFAKIINDTFKANGIAIQALSSIHS
ncbi:5-oxoprolinase subunit PxpA [Bacillus sp. FJAT-50079]|uniref:LamB/YcsF family protein n=1 Tax=Bacillus sp. FJAT-50079 TaxID=2833577 RepID=UPI001BC8F937|nr:5-oxoprolinase subunit PxpA [Bacillus sp. FJAT-50079]MBS4210249.1 LamB/YcsF family protein [Bacillus sp. FJAT-50079]